MRSRSLTLTLTLIVIVTGASAAGAGARARVPQGFVGMMVDGPLWPSTAPGVDLVDQFGRMVQSGVESVRVVFDWRAAQPYASWSEVPPSQQAQFTDGDGVPTRFGPLDELVALAAQRHLVILPVVLYTPKWDAAPHPNTSFAIPTKSGPYARFLTALIQRYGPEGTFWQSGGPRDAIHSWQVWNEPNITVFWPRQPFAHSYVKLLHAAHDAIRRADPSASVVLAGMPNASWIQLRTIYRQPGARKLFDVVAIHPYTKEPQGVITILDRVRSVMDAAGDRSKPILAGEVGWPSSQGKTNQGQEFDIGTTEAGQARRLTTLLPLLQDARRRLRLIGFDYYTWATVEQPGAQQFDFAGLLRYHNAGFATKPAYRAFRRAALALEACASKGRVATVCARRR